MLLARLGVGQLVMFDDDITDVTNLNRLHGARRADADAMRPKVEVVAHEITELGLGVRVVPIRHWIDQTACRDALKACDVIFGCTDDHDGRLLLNRFAYFYLIPVIDMGLAIDPKPDKSGLRDLTGRITVLFLKPLVYCAGASSIQLWRATKNCGAGRPRSMNGESAKPMSTAEEIPPQRW